MIRTHAGMMTWFCLALAGAAPLAPAQDTAGQDAAADQDAINPNWPRVFDADGATISIYQPQVEKWTGNQLEARAAVAIQTPAAAHPTYGVAWFTARTDVNKTTRTVDLHDFAVAQVNFPTGNEDYKTLIQNNIPQDHKTMSLDRLQASLRVSEAEAPVRHVSVKNNVPRIFVSGEPAVLVLIDGQPKLRETDQSNLLRVINTRALLVLDKPNGTYYLYVSNGWYQAKGIDDSWTRATNPPTGLDAIKHQAVEQRMVDLFDKPGKEAQAMLNSGKAPKIFVSTTPASLIEMNGGPDWQPVAGTNLLYMANTMSTVIRDIDNQRVYVLLAGRWFAASSLDGPWSYIAHDSLPASFAKIPANHPKGDALVSVAGTPQAQEAAIASTIPQTATVVRDQAQLEVQYDGQPKFEPIPEADCAYAVNTPTPVVRISPSEYYACSNGVWFVSSAPVGPWVVATSVPPQIYRIPPSCPIYYTRYVRIYGYTPQVVYVGYYPGYYGTYITPSGCVVYGTGYIYPPYVGTVWIGPPATYGFGAGFAWGFATGFALGYATGAWCHPWWGPVGYGYGWGYRNVNVNVNIYNINVYNRWKKSAVVAHSGNRWYGRAGNTRAFGTKGGNIYADHNGNVYRRENGQWQHYQNGQWNNINRHKWTPRRPENGQLGGGGRVEQALTDGQLQNRIHNWQGNSQLGQDFNQWRDSGRMNNWLNRQEASRQLGDSRFDNFRQNYGQRLGGSESANYFGGRGFNGGGFGGFHGGGDGHIGGFRSGGGGGFRGGGGRSWR